MTKQISIFFKEKGAGLIRGKQIGEYIGAKLNPESGYENDVCIYVKIQPPEKYPTNTYLDIVDAQERISWLQNHPDVKVIASSLSGMEYLKKKIFNKPIYIPQHHCNFKREISTGDKVGFVGGLGSYNEDVSDMFDNFLWFDSRGKTREQIVNGYKRLKLQVVWRTDNMPLKNPLKIINAMSFGIPTIAFPEQGNKEVEEFYLKAGSIYETIQIPDLNKEKLIAKAEEYHIENISKLYTEL